MSELHRQLDYSCKKITELEQKCDNNESELLSKLRQDVNKLKNQRDLARLTAFSYRGMWESLRMQYAPCDGDEEDLAADERMSKALEDAAYGSDDHKDGGAHINCVFCQGESYGLDSWHSLCVHCGSNLKLHG